MKRYGHCKIGLQFFAEPPADEPVTLTKVQVEELKTSAVESGKQELLKALGISDYTDMAKTLETLKGNIADAGKLAAVTTGKETAETTLKDINGKYQVLQNKWDAISVGVNMEAADDVVTLAMPKVTDKVTFKSVVEDMKKNPIFASFFAANRGTGGQPPAGGQGTGAGAGAESYGAKLAAQTNTGKASKTYFK